MNFLDRLPVTPRYALRNLARNRRRTLLSAGGLALGCSVALVAIGWNRGKNEMLINALAEGGAGHLTVAPQGWLESRGARLRLNQGSRVLAMLRADPAVRVATPENRVQALLAMGTRMVGVEIQGVDPATEPGADRLVRKVALGRYLLPSDRQGLVLGRTLADRLGVGPGDSLVVTVTDSTGSMKNAMFQVLGVVDLKSKLDAAICQANLKDVEALSGLPGEEKITVLLKDPSRLGPFLAGLRPRLPRGDRAWPWQEVSPDIANGVRLDTVFVWLIDFILVVIALLGVASAQLTAVLERRREFAVLSALGMRGGSMLKLLLGEALALGTLSLLVTLAISCPALLYLSRVGIDLGSGMDVAGVALVDSVMRADFGPWIIWESVLLSYAATLAASLYPAWFATRLDPAEALRVAQ